MVGNIGECVIKVRIQRAEEDACVIFVRHIRVKDRLMVLLQHKHHQERNFPQLWTRMLALAKEVVLKGR